MYLGGNGFYWVTSAPTQKPWLIEVRKGDTGDGGRVARPGEHHHSTTAERGGLWRHRARAPQKLWGVGMVAHSMDASTSYVQLRDSRDPRVEWLVKGIQPEERVGNFGPTGGAAGEEIDAIDYSLGTPPNALLIAASIGHSAKPNLFPRSYGRQYQALAASNIRGCAATLCYSRPREGAPYSALVQ